MLENVKKLMKVSIAPIEFKSPNLASVGKKSFTIYRKFTTSKIAVTQNFLSEILINSNTARA